MAQARPAARRPRPSAALADYRRKRDLAKSGEPAGGARPISWVPSFVIQKHDATRLHYDFRLEADGVLKSWAVPKGLPTKVGDKALAIEVEDHPLDYGGFEGTIPEGNYGAGTVMLWDRGVYALEGDFAAAHRAGKIHVALAGAKSRGEWTLVRMPARGQETKTNWLIIRNHTSTRLKATTQPVPRDKSVLTGRTMEQIAAGRKPAARKAARRKRTAAKAATGDDDEAAVPRAAGPPKFIEPMKALGVTAIPAGEWHSEIKFDGYRALGLIQRGKAAQLWSRNEKALGPAYPEVTAALAKLKCTDAIVDGEVVALDAKGRSHFQLLQQRERAEARPPIHYYVFDLLRLDGRSYVNEPIERRRAVLKKLLGPAKGVVRLSASFDASPEKLLEQARKLGLEGIVAKAAGSLYEPGRRSGMWLKCRISSEQEFVIGGYTPPEGARRYFGALLLGYYQGQELMYAGKVGTGFDENRLAEIHGQLAARVRPTCPFANLPAKNRPRFGEPMNAAAMARVHWVRPEVVGQVRFAEWTADGRLRHPVFIGVRKDKRAREVVREAPAAK
jgi:bifunctional non-homologous end joining protein LigD